MEDQTDISSKDMAKLKWERKQTGARKRNTRYSRHRVNSRKRPSDEQFMGLPNTLSNFNED